MDDEPPPLIQADAEAAEKRSLIEDVKELAEDGRTVVEAELAYQQSRAAVAGTGARGVAAWGALALALVFFALMALVVGLLLGLTTVVGPWLATLITVVALAAFAGAAGFVAKARWQRTAKALSSKGRGA